MKATSFGILLAFIVVLGLIAQPSYASNSIAKREGASCTTCHDKPGSKLLTDRGKYYELKGSFEGFDQIQANFGQCTSCHVRKPGSLKLTDRGKRYRWIFEDMDGIKEWLMKLHVDGDEKTAASTDDNKIGGEPSEPISGDK